LPRTLQSLSHCWLSSCIYPPLWVCVSVYANIKWCCNSLKFFIRASRAMTLFTRLLLLQLFLTQNVSLRFTMGTCPPALNV
jgi:hypothetical protein